MGVPKFFRWISERYPCLSVSVNNNQIPNFDCLYLDMNGIIHICSHPDDSNVQFRITETDIFSNIFNYVEFLFKTVKPKDVFFLAVDGVAPRAKMNQQRARRFKSAKEAINREEAAKQSGIKLPDEKRFDSNAITPGTEFMDRLQTALKDFLDEKIKTDSLWQGVDVILSGHETPGEGEHKIQEFIRYRRSLPNYNPNTRHCLYGLDADLMLLGLASHEPYFSLLREEVTFSKKKTKRAYIAEESKFFLLHLSLLREYIDYEFHALKSSLGDKYSLERIIDDWIVMSFLVGNDFVPHLPNLHIHTSALPFLWETYVKIRPILEGYINEFGKLNLDNLLQYISALSIFDVNIFMENYEDMKWMLGKTGERLGMELENLDNNNKQQSNSSPGVVCCDNASDESLVNFETSLADFFGDSTNEFSENHAIVCDGVMENDFTDMDIFSTPLDINRDCILPIDLKISDPVTDQETDYEPGDVNESQLTVEMEALKVDKDLIEFDYSENKNINGNVPNHCDQGESDLNICTNFGLSTSVDGDDKDLWELQYRCYKRNYYYSKLGLTVNDEVLVEQAKEYITALQWISYYYFCGVPSWDWFYPQHYAPFTSDLSYLSAEIRSNGISFNLGRPFLPFEQLMAVLPADSCELLPSGFQTLMTDENSPIIDFYPKTFKTDLNGKKKDWEAVVLIPFIVERRLLEALETKKESLSKYEIQRNVHGPHLKFRYSKDKLTISEINPELFRIPNTSILLGLCPNVRLDVICQGFPTFKHIEHTFTLEKVGVKIFEFTANSSSILLNISPPTVPIVVENVARDFINKVAYVNWPAFFEVKVVAVLSETHKYIFNAKTKEIVSEPLSDIDSVKMKEFKKTTPRSLFKRSAISIDETNFLILETHHTEGKTYEISGTHKAGSTVRLAHNWNTVETFWHLYQMSVLKESIDTFESNSSKMCTKLNQLFPKTATVFSLSVVHYGRAGRVVSINNLNPSIRVILDTLKEPIFPLIDLQSVGEHEYMNAVKATEFFDINPLLFSRITGTLYVNLFHSLYHPEHQRLKRSERNKSQIAIGLELKNNKFNLQIPGWVVKGKSDNFANKWLYSMKVVNVLEEYRQKFPEVFDFIQRPNFEELVLEDLYDREILSQKALQLSQFLDNLPYKSLERISNDNQVINETHIQMLEAAVDDAWSTGNVVTEKPVTLEFGFHDLYRPHHSLHGVKPDKSAVFELLDRVVCSTDGYTVPLGLRGVVIGIESKPHDIRLEVLFDREFKSAISIRGSKPRCYRMPAHTLINVSYGMRQQKTPAKVSNDVHTNHKAAGKKKRASCVTEVTPDIVNTLSSSGIDGAAGVELPVDVVDGHSKSNNCSTTTANQKRFIAHCDKLFVEEAPARSFVKTITAHNSIAEYTQLFMICQQSGIINPRVVERHENGSVYMSFLSDKLSLPESKETNLDSGRVNIIKRVWNYIFPQWQPQLASAELAAMNHHYRSPPPPYQQHHHYMPKQFENNPFMQIYPQQSPRNHVTRQASNSAPMCPLKASTPIDKVRSEAGSCSKGPKKRFIRCPKPHNTLFNNP